MKRLAVIVAVLGLLLGGAFALQRAYGIQENVLYTEELLGLEQKQQTQESLVTRIQALEQAYAIFGQGLGISLLDSDITMNVNLYYDKAGEGSYKWSMTWLRESTLDSYSCTIDAISGTLLNLYVYELSHEEMLENPRPLTKKEAKAIMRSFLKVIGRDPAEYVIKGKPETIPFDQTVYKRYKLEQKKEKADHIVIEIDQTTRKIILFQKDTGE